MGIIITKGCATFGPYVRHQIGDTVEDHHEGERLVALGLARYDHEEPEGPDGETPVAPPEGPNPQPEED